PLQVQVTFQDDRGVVPVLVTFTSALKPPPQSLLTVEAALHAGVAPPPPPPPPPPPVPGKPGALTLVRYPSFTVSTVCQSSFRMPPVSPELGFHAQKVQWKE